MRGLRCFGLAIGLLIGVASASVPSLAAVLYATGSGATALSGLFEIDPQTGAATLLRQYSDLYLYQGGLVYDASQDAFFATGTDLGSVHNLYRIDARTFDATLVGPVGPYSIGNHGLAIHPQTGVLYATGYQGNQSTALFTLDKQTGAATFLGLNGRNCCVDPFGFVINGLGFRDDGTLFGNGYALSGLGGQTNSHLFTLDLASGAATPVGFHGVSAPYGDIAFAADGTMLTLGRISASSDGLYSIDPATGAATLIGASAVVGGRGGLAFAVPEPSIAALGLAFGLIALRRARRG